MRKQEIKYLPSVSGWREFEKRAQVRYNGPDKEFASIVPSFVPIHRDFGRAGNGSKRV